VAIQAEKLLIWPSKPTLKRPCQVQFSPWLEGCHAILGRQRYDSTIKTLHEAIEEAKLEQKDKYNAVKRLEQYTKP